MTRKEEVRACIKDLKMRIPATLELMERVRGIESIKEKCKELIKETQELMKYIEEYEELDS